MVTMVALQYWKGKEGRIVPGDRIEVDEPRAQQLEGYETSTGRTMSPTQLDEEATTVTVRRNPRAKRLEEATTTKGGPTAAQREGQHDKPAPEVGPDATDAARELARQHGVSVADVGVGTGKNYRVTRADVAAVYGEPPANE